MKPKLLRIEGNLAARYVDGRLDQMIQFEPGDITPDWLEYLRAHGMPEEEEMQAAIERDEAEPGLIAFHELAFQLSEFPPAMSPRVVEAA